MASSRKRSTAFLYTDAFLAYKLGDRHPLQQRRLQMVYRLLRAYGALEPEGPIAFIEPPPATEREILRVHTQEYVEALRRASLNERPDRSFLARYGLAPGDTPAFPGMYDVAALYAGGTMEAARLVATGQYAIAFNVAGGLHHGHPAKARGFCALNDLAMGIYHLLDAGFERIACIDIDVHHGDGTQFCFYNDPRVLTISLHESGEFLFPGTGFPEESGGAAAFGTVINVPFFPQTGDRVWHQAFDAVVPPAFERFRPQAVVLQLGADAHYADRLGHLLLTSRGWMRAVEKLLALSVDLPVIVTGGGGYQVKTVARLWTMVTACCAGVVLPDETPAEYAATYDIACLHDTETPPSSPDVETATLQYVEQMIYRLNEAQGSDFVLAE